ncbi:hypothetical protein GCM10018781_02720 [Kitasatospora indigofera]|uniref:Uncharacterized protein n=1 Tax=Kitasatospora indigofera TaxID=67307 RepID=A0A919KKD0_9ACTN|nr:hypothetical protein GCM10018781_02720 [Kitasatospora indigofera]
MTAARDPATRGDGGRDADRWCSAAPPALRGLPVICVLAEGQQLRMRWSGQPYGGAVGSGRERAGCPVCLSVEIVVVAASDGLLVDVTEWSAEELADGVALLTELGTYGAGGRSPNGCPLRWD